MIKGINGSMPALVTPFKNGALDLDTLKKLVDWHIAEGSSGIVPVGTTGESPTLSHDEHERVVEEVVKAVAGRVPVIAGAGSNNTQEAVELAVHAEKAGADAGRIAGWFEQAGWEKLLNRAGTTFKKLPDEDKADIDAAKAVMLMAANPSAIRRPVVEVDGKLIAVGFKPGEWEEVISPGL